MMNKVNSNVLRSGHFIKSEYANKLIPVFIGLIIFLMMVPQRVESQLARERAVQTRYVDKVFWAGSNIGVSTVENLPAGNLNSTIMHTFGLVDGGIDRFFGMDDGANTRLGIDYGLSDRISVGIGRMTFNKIVDLRSKISILRQTTSGSRPVSLAVKIAAGINTTPGLGLEFAEKLSYLASVMIARKSGPFSIQITPMVAFFNRTVGTNPDQLFGTGILLNYNISERFSLSTEYLPLFGTRNASTKDAMGVAVNIDTGGHIFQMFLTTSQWHGEQYIMANNSDRFFKGDFRFGFNIHRVFGLKR
jgi:hypothetical protein